MNAKTSNAPTLQGRGAGKANVGQTWQANTGRAEVLLQRLEGVQAQGKGWRAICPACGGRSRKLSVTEAADRVLLHCFAGCKAIDVLEAAGLNWGDIMPPKSWPETPEERRQLSNNMREAAWGAALATVATEATIARIAAAQMLRDEPLEWDDYCRLVKACELIDGAASVLTGARR
ncbi:MAG: hypothetical protein ACOH2R_26810 [Pseudomonas sp.]